VKVLQVNCVYREGSTGKIVADIHRELKSRGIESVVCYGRGARCSETDVHKVCGEFYSHVNHFLANLTGIMYGGCFFSTNRLLSIIKKEKPDVVHLHCINGYFVNIYRLIRWLKRNRIRTVLTLHAEFMYTGNCGHANECNRWKVGCGSCPRWRKETKSYLFDRTAASWKRMKAAFEGFRETLLVTSVSPWLMDRAKQSPILGDKQHMVVMNGLDTEIFQPCPTEELRRRHGLTDERIVFHATPSFSLDPNHLKGGYYVNLLARKLKDQNVKVLVAGNCVGEVDVPDNVILLGRITDQRTLAEYYCAADVTVLTSKKETFSMVTAESLACGTPVVGFKAGGPEQIAIPEYSRFVEYGDVDGLAEEIYRLFQIRENKCTMASSGKKKYAQDKMAEGYLYAYHSVNETCEEKKIGSEI